MGQDNLKKWQTTSSRYLVDDRWLKLRADSCVTPEGHAIEPYYVIEYNDWICCVVIDKQGQVLLLRHYRHGIGEYVLEMVGGGIEADDASPMEATKREVREELGYAGGQLYQTGASFVNPANQTHRLHSFLAVGGSRKHLQELGPGENFEIETISFNDFIKLITTYDTDEVYQSLHLVTVFFALNFIRRSSDKRLAGLKKQLQLFERGEGDV